MPQREKVTFPTNVPVPVTLEFNDGTLVPGKFGDQYQYFLAGDRIMWVDAQVRDVIRATGAGAGDEVIITKRETRQGTKRTVTWEAEKREEEPEPPESEQSRAWRAEAAARAQQPAPSPQPAPTPAAAPAPSPAAAPAPKTNGRTNGHQAAAPIATAPPAETPAHAPYFEAFRLALDTARDVEAYGASIGRAIAFTTEDLRAMAATLYMGARR